MTKGIPPQFMDVLAHQHASPLLVLLRSAQAPVRYSEARRRLGFSPTEFQRALVLLEDSGLVLTRAPAQDRDAEREQRRRVVFLETTPLGNLLADFATHMGRDFHRLAKQQHLDRALAAVED